MKREDKLAAWLQSQGVDCSVESYRNQVEDGSIKIRPDLHIQVGRAYVCLVQKIGNAFKWLYNGTDFNTLLSKIKTA